MTTPTPAAPARGGDATRGRLLRAAVELFTTVGFRATTTPAIAAKAGVAEGTIYRHFTGKEHLLNEAYRGAQRWGCATLKELEESDRGLKAPERLLRVAGRLLETAERDAAVLRMLLYPRDDRNLDERSREAAREFRDALQQIVAGGKSDGLVRSGPADLWTSVWLAVVAFAAERVSAREWTPDHPQAALALEAAWDAIRQQPGAPAATSAAPPTTPGAPSA
jgi:AcrR family transcriptional regulator